MPDLKLMIVIFGCAATVMGGVARLCKWPNWTGLVLIVIGVIVGIGGYVRWDYERREASWELTECQRDKLRLALVSRIQKFPIVLYPVHSNNLSEKYAYDIIDLLSSKKWPYIFKPYNWVVPTTSVGLIIATCQGRPNPDASELKKILDEAGIPSKEGGSEEDLLNLGCPVGLIIGQPPPAANLPLWVPLWVPFASIAER